MRLPNGGLDIYYIDESTDRNMLVLCAVAIPFLRLIDGTWTIVWQDHLTNLRDWRRRLSKGFDVPVRKELKGSKFAAGRGRYYKGKHQLQRADASLAYRALLGDLGFLPSRSIITAVGTPKSQLYGHSRLEAVLYALLQRMRTACTKTDRVGMVFFDEGHGEYRKLYRKAMVYLPTGSDRGDWGTGAASINIPLDNFVKDANTKDSKHSLFTQLADMVSFAALLKIRGEQKTLAPWQAALGLETLYDAIPMASLNIFASRTDPQGIVRLP
jgi:hypothetical protein